MTAEDIFATGSRQQTTDTSVDMRYICVRGEGGGIAGVSGRGRVSMSRGCVDCQSL